MKKIMYIVVGIALGAGIFVNAEKLERLGKPHIEPAGKVAVKDTATSTEYATKFQTIDMLPEYDTQATCFRMRSSADGGLLYVTGTSAGLSVSSSGCGL